MTLITLFVALSFGLPAFDPGGLPPLAEPALLLCFAVGGISWAGKKRLNFAVGCDKVSRGCARCYIFPKIEGFLTGMNNPRYENGTQVTLHPDVIERPLSWKKPRLIFVNSMGDAFHEAVPTFMIQRLFEVMNEADHHVYQLLTKRTKRLARLGPSLPWADHIWMGTSVEDDEPYNADGDRPTDRIEHLRQCGAIIRWLSIEPLLGPLHDLNLRGIHWVALGGESGKLDTVRPMKLSWARSVVRQCRDGGVPVHVKQLGTRWAHENGLTGKAADPSEWPEDLRVREQPRIFDGQPLPVEDVIG
jgi:protein gp37